MTQSLLNRVPVIPVVVVDDVDHAVPIARALVAGGLPVIELTLRTPVALDAIERIAGEVPEIFLGAGTIVLRSKVVRGLTTAASLWTVAAVGLAVGGGLYVAAATTTAGRAR